MTPVSIVDTLMIKKHMYRCAAQHAALTVLL